jgi:ribonuclease MRP protein subunit RMP1
MASPSRDDVTHAQHRCLELLGPAQGILDLFNHRNKNQHRLSRWWKQFDMLRRGIRKLIAELEDYLGAEAKAIAKRKKSKKGNSAQPELDAERARMEVRTRYVLEQLVPRAFLYVIHYSL